MFFFISSWIQFDRLSASINAAQDDPIATVFSDYEAKNPTPDIDYLKWKTRTLLERDVIGHRYRQVNATLLLRAWTCHLGFLTGMILSFIGGIFILTKLSEDVTQIGAEGGGLKGSLATSSPGIVLTVVGGVLMGITLVADYQFTTRDIPAYIGPEGHGGAALPQDLPDLSDETSRKEEEADLFKSQGEAK
ncbi:hypothetical protein GRI89_13050 [Altererythrobacter salegens]|uniref:Uncharacterized protein n=1 Tax=Croceibacterium salegens TaxID=1737568 RepID=A0A6I4SZZ6_9SPHN|nr:hypothetical protein [Croceibacterium salegens]